MVLTRSCVRRTALWVVPVSDLAGVARHVLDVLRAGIPGWRIVLLAPPGPLAEVARNAGAAVLAEPFGPEHGLPRSLLSLRRAIAHVTPQVVHSHLSYADIVCALVSRRDGPRLISTEHGIARDDNVYHRSAIESHVMRVVHRVRIRRLAALIAVSQATRAAVVEKWRPPPELLLEVIPNGVDRTEDPATGQPGFRIGAIARLAPEKGLVDLVDAFAQVHRAHPEAHLTLAGSGPLAAELAQRADAHGLAGAVELPGYRDSSAALAELDVLAQLSIWENCSYSLLDAVSAGVGAVATDVGGNPELLPQRCLVAVGDVDRAAAVLLEQATKPELRPTLPAGWPTVGDMAGAIKAVYERAAQ